MAECPNLQDPPILKSSDSQSLTEQKESKIYYWDSIMDNCDDSCDKLYEDVYCKTVVDKDSLEIQFCADSMSTSGDSKTPSPNWHEDFETLKPNYSSSTNEVNDEDFKKEPQNPDDYELQEKWSEESDSNIYSSVTEYSQNILYEDCFYQDDQYKYVHAQPSSPKLNSPTKVSPPEGLNKLKNFVQKGITDNSKKRKQQKKWKMFKKSGSLTKCKIILELSKFL